MPVLGNVSVCFNETVYYNPGHLKNNRLKAGVHMKAVFWLVINISFTFQAIKNLYAHPTYQCFGSFCKFLGDF